MFSALKSGSQGQNSCHEQLFLMEIAYLNLPLHES